MHLLVGTKGSGKSSLFRTWIAEALASGKNVFIRLSEDKTSDYTDELATFFNEEAFHLFKNLTIESEMDLTDSEKQDYFADLEMKVKNAGADVIFFDNFTTSAISRKGIAAEADSAVKLRMLADKLEIPLVVAAHTEKGFKGNSVASGDNVRGNQTIANVAAYIYGITVFFNHPDKPTVIFTDKARHHSDSNKKYYRIEFNKSMNTYIKDWSLSIAEIKDILKYVK
jgi:hypothetical protein